MENKEKEIVWLRPPKRDAGLFVTLLWVVPVAVVITAVVVAAARWVDWVTK